MTIHQFCDQDMAIGLTWLAPVVWPSTGRERRKTHALSSLDMEVAGYTEIETTSGLQLGATEEIADLGLTSAAAVLAQAQDSVVLIERLANDLYWLCTIEESSVFPAGDLVGNKQQIKERLNEIRSDIAGKNIRLYDKFGDFHIDEAQKLDFSELVDDITPSANLKCRPIQRRNLSKPVAGIVLIVLLACSAVGTWQYIDSINYEDEKKFQRQLAHQQALEKEKRALELTLQQNSSALLATFADVVFDRPLRAGGWRTHSYEWQNNVISVSWQREHGDVDSIASYLGTSEFELSENTKSLIEKVPFDASVRTDSRNLENRLESYSSRLSMLDRLERMPGKWSLMPAEVIEKNLPVVRSQLTGGSNQLSQMIAVAISLKDLPMYISRIKVNLKNSFNWELEAEYFAHAE